MFNVHCVSLFKISVWFLVKEIVKTSGSDDDVDKITYLYNDKNFRNWISDLQQCLQFLVKDNVAVEVAANTVSGLYSDEYWSNRYIINEENVPVFLTQVQEIILRTGRYLNVVRQCSETST